MITALTRGWQKGGLSLWGLAFCGCGAQALTFETSDRPPDIAPSESFEPLTPEVARLPVPKARLHEATAGFLLALENRSPEGLGEVMTADAVLRTETGGGSSPAIAELLELSSAWSPTSRTGATGLTSPASPFGPADIVEISEDSEPPWATIHVTGPAKVKGEWRVRFVDASGLPRIAEVVLPKAR